MTDTDLDIIPDLHGDIDRLDATLAGLNYRVRSGAHRHPANRRAVFLGDFIDTGTANAAVIDTVRRMTDAGSAMAVMGNHELNALLYHEPGSNSAGRPDGFMRAHTAENTGQHASFLAEFPLGGAGTRDVLAWFRQLPLLLDLGDLHVVHAAWDPAAVAELLGRRPDARLASCDLQEVALEETGFAQSVQTLLKGPELPLPDGAFFRDHKGQARTRIRAKWWQPSTAWRDIALSVPDPRELPEGTPEQGGVRIHAPDAGPVVFGHYKMTGTPQVATTNALCLDYPAMACAYRWNGEGHFHGAGLRLV